jgi:hypothetical protein
MAQSLDEVRDDLYELFNRAVKNAKNTYDSQFAQQGMFAAAKLADSLARVEGQIAENDARKNGLRLPGKQ